MKNVYELSVDAILDNASKGYYQIPNFQREFIWTIKDIGKLAESAALGMPCGAIVTWDNPDNFPSTGYHSVRIPVTKAAEAFIEFPPPGVTFPVPNIVIDGLQRITALSIAFGGLRHRVGNQRIPGKFFINLDHPTIAGSITYKTPKQIESEELDKEETWVSTGLFPLYSNDKHQTEKLSNSQSAHWGKVQFLVSADSDRLTRAVLINKNTGSGIIADMQIGGEHELSEIADTFEMLNTQGTTVSMVDILHSTLYAWYDRAHQREFELRDWIDGINKDSNYSHGWGNREKRQIILQFGAAIDLLSSSPLGARVNASKAPDNIDTKSILNMNESFWYKLEQNEVLFKDCIKQFQLCVIDGQFPQAACPYPISASIYIALYWKLKNEKNITWTHKRLNQIFRAFFWTNSLSENYETDSMGVRRDMNDIEKLLNETHNDSDKQWKKIADQWLGDWLVGKKPLPIPSQLQDSLMKKEYGALRDALLLPIKYLPTLDLIDPSSAVSYPSPVEVHHIFPKKWIKGNGSPANLGVHYNSPSLAEFIDSPANKTSLISDSNKKWSADSPGTVMLSNLMSQTNQQKGETVWTERFIKDDTFEALKDNSPKSFIELRAEEIEKWLTAQCKIQL